VILTDEPNYNENAIVSFERRSGLLKYTGMQFIDGTRVKTIPEGSTLKSTDVRVLAMPGGQVKLSRTINQL